MMSRDGGDKVFRVVRVSCGKTDDVFGRNSRFRSPSAPCSGFADNLKLLLKTGLARGHPSAFDTSAITQVLATRVTDPDFPTSRIISFFFRLHVDLRLHSTE